MDTATVLSRNLQGLIDDSQKLSEHSLSVTAGVPKTTIRRMRLAEGSAQIDSVEKVAKAFHLRACDILDPDLVKRIKAREPLRMGEPRPPVMPDDVWKSMSARSRALIEDISTLTLAGKLKDDDVAWLHDAMQRIAQKPD